MRDGESIKQFVDDGNWNVDDLNVPDCCKPIIANRRQMYTRHK